jgi:hypothetical protein
MAEIAIVLQPIKTVCTFAGTVVGVSRWRPSTPAHELVLNQKRMIDHVGKEKEKRKEEILLFTIFKVSSNSVGEALPNIETLAHSNALFEC